MRGIITHALKQVPRRLSQALHGRVITHRTMVLFGSFIYLAIAKYESGVSPDFEFVNDWHLAR